MLRKTGNPMMGKKIFFMVIVLLACLPGIALCLEVTAHVDKTKISPDDSIFLKVELKQGKAELDLTMIRDFKVIPRGTTSVTNIINGSMERSFTHQYVLVPLKNGELKIPPIKAVGKKETVFTREILINVSERLPESGETKALFARSEVTKTRLFQGQQAVYSLSFFTSKRLSGLGFESLPRFNGFSVTSFEKEKTYGRIIGGIQYQVTRVDYLIIPSVPGKLTIDPAVLVARVVMKTNRDPFFDSFFSSGNSKPVRVSSNPVEIEVLPLPHYQGQDKFSGLIGDFTLEADMDKTSVNSGESMTLTLTISGLGNIMDAGFPQIHLDADKFKVYDDNPVEAISLTPRGYEGTRTFKKAVVPVIPGKFTIPPVSLVYFDADSKTYQKVSTDPIQLDITPSEEIVPAVRPLNRSTEGIVKKEVTIENTDILEIKEGLGVVENHGEITPLFFMLLFCLPPLLFSCVKVIMAFQKKEIPIEKQMEEKARYHIKKAGKQDTGDTESMGHLYTGLVAFVLAKGKRKGETVTPVEAGTILNKAGVAEKAITDVTNLLETIESIRFGGKTPDKNMRDKLFSRAKKALRLLCVAIIFTGASTLMPQKAMADSAGLFIDGIQYYKAGDFKAAAENFEQITKGDIKNPYLYYNIANAYLKDNDIGRAVLWYERAKYLAPNDPDIKFNLGVANTRVKDKKEDVMGPMEILFFWEHIIAPKRIEVAALFLSLLFFSWAAVRTIKRQPIFSGAGIILFSILVLVTAIVTMNYYERSQRLHAVIISLEVPVRSGMTDTSTQLFTLHAGTKVRVTREQGEYLKILFGKSRIGWVKAGEVEIIQSRVNPLTP